jgi:exodeoxyribonuclease VII small subunit
MTDTANTGEILGQLASLATSTDYEAVRDGLNAAIQLLEQPGLGLNDSVRAYQVGRQLAERCQQLLDEAELRITELDGGSPNPGAGSFGQ